MSGFLTRQTVYNLPCQSSVLCRLNVLNQHLYFRIKRLSNITARIADDRARSGHTLVSFTVPDTVSVVVAVKISVEYRYALIIVPPTVAGIKCINFSFNIPEL